MMLENDHSVTYHDLKERSMTSAWFRTATRNRDHWGSKKKREKRRRKIRWKIKKYLSAVSAKPSARKCCCTTERSTWRSSRSRTIQSCVGAGHDTRSQSWGGGSVFIFSFFSTPRILAFVTIRYGNSTRLQYPSDPRVYCVSDNLPSLFYQARNEFRKVEREDDERVLWGWESGWGWERMVPTEQKCAIDLVAGVWCLVSCF